jgi:predicted ATPase
VGDRFVVLSGCSGGGKSTLLTELRKRGYATVEEPGRRIVREELARDGTSLPWINLAAFARRAIEVSLADRAEMTHQLGWIFFDRGLVDAAAALEHVTAEPILEPLGLANRYHTTAFFTPPWPEIFLSDPERKDGLDEAIAEYKRLERAYFKLGYRVIVLPKASVEARADTVLAELKRRAT